MAGPNAWSASPFSCSNVFEPQMAMAKPRLRALHNTGIVVASLDNAIAFFAAIGMKLEGRGLVEGEWAGRVTGLGDQSVEIAMMVTPDGNSRLELCEYHKPAVIADHRTAPVNALGYLRVMFNVEDLDGVVAELTGHGAVLVGEIMEYASTYRLCYMRGVEGILIGLAEELQAK